MKCITICKAETTVDSIESVVIKIQEKLPSFSLFSEQDDFMTKEACFLEKSLYFSLPGGTYDRLLSAMLIRKASHFRVAHARE